MTPDLRQRVSGALVLLLLCLGLSAVVSPTVSAAAPDARSDRASERASERVSERVKRWPGSTITYSESLPAKWDPSLQLAVEAWNSSGGDLRFKKVSPSKAQVKISYGNTRGYGGLATIGPVKNAYVLLSNAFKKAELTLEQKYNVGRLLTHELGHVVGFDHVGKGCQLMVTIWPAECGVLSFTPGYRVCRWIDKPLLKSFIAAYGGKAKLAPKECPIDPLPPQLKSVVFSGGAGAGTPVTVTWTPQSAKPGERVHIYVRAGACPSNPEGNSPDLEAFVSPTVGAWSDPEGDNAGGPTCYLVEVVNKTSAAQKPFSKVLNRYQQLPAAPSISNIVYDEPNARWAFDATWPADTYLVARRVFAGDGSCPSDVSFDDAYEEFFGHADPLLIYDLGSTECIKFLSETANGVRSPTVTAAFVIPP